MRVEWVLENLDFHGIIEWPGLERTLNITQFQSSAMARDKNRLFRIPSNLALNTSRDGASIASLGSLCQDLTMLTVNFFPNI